MPTSQVTVQFETDHLDPDEPVLLYAGFKIEWSVDHNYGADADGRRGVTAYFMDDVDLLSIYNDEGPLIIENLPPEVIEEAHERLDDMGMDIHEDDDVDWKIDMDREDRDERDS